MPYTRLAAFVLTVACGCAVELEGLYGARGGNRVTLCMAPGASRDACAGVIWQRHWLLVRGSCVAERPLFRALVLRTSDAACDAIAPDEKVSGSRKVRARFLHTSYPQTDVALICLDRPYDALDPVRNDSNAALYKLEPWLSDTFNQYLLTTPRAQSIHEHRDMIFSSPVKMFVTTVVLPLTSFIVFFLFITFFTGSNKSTVTYKSLHNDKDGNFA
ncbi:unnamed protein product, partial [Iphiclides podalirius]